jgi:hypothetical protein
MPIVISVAEDHLPRIREVAARLRAAGMDVKDVLAEAGVISGSAEPSLLPALSRVEGVEAAEPSREIRIAPPDSDVQ